MEGAVAGVVGDDGHGDFGDVDSAEVGDCEETGDLVVFCVWEAEGGADGCGDERGGGFDAAGEDVGEDADCVEGAGGVEGEFHGVGFGGEGVRGCEWGAAGEVGEDGVFVH